MLFPGNRTYFPDHLGMEAKLDIILKELYDLKLRVEVSENKIKGRALETTLEIVERTQIDVGMMKMT